MSIVKTRELFHSALHILCGSGSTKSRMLRAYQIIANIVPARDLPRELISDYYELQLQLNTIEPRKGESAVYAGVVSLNQMDCAVIIDLYINIYKRLAVSASKYA
ncbi:hypothetical protein [Psychromonas aquimarina]|uniref:hypothetical protein n=1 Tax=Psychromonas aquimarina TaxID=444919 RepID=UPI00042988F6|nr:hypothetical protein [Psychromonas aquimarina]